jgi:DNA polymerase
MRATIDFETRSALKIQTVGAWIYSIHFSTEPICLAYALGETDEPILWAPDWAMDIVGPWYETAHGVPLWLDCPWLHPGPCPEPLVEAIVSGSQVEAHNAFFERSIWSNIMRPRFGWPEIPESAWRCSAAKASAYALPRALEDAVAALDLPYPKDMDGHRTMQKVSRPRIARKLEKKDLYNNGCREAGDGHGWRHVRTGRTFYLWNEKPEDIFRTWVYCRQDVRAERALSQTLTDLSSTELAVWRADQAINLRGIRVDRTMAEGALQIADQAVERATEKAVEICDGAFETLGQRDKLIAWVQDQGVIMRNAQGPYIDQLLAGALPESVRIVLECKKTASRTSVRKYAKMLQTADPNDDRIRDVYMYHGAGTGRWSGRFVQPQNLVRGKMKDPETMCAAISEGSVTWLDICYGPTDPMEILSWATRGALCAPDGRELYVADYSGVEARGLLWFVDDIEGLAIFRRPKGEPGIYREMAFEIYKKSIHAITDDERQMGKRAILGLGYGMGDRKFRATCAQYGQVVSAKFCKYVVATYRKRFYRVVQSWKRLESAAIKAMRNPEQPFPADKVIFLRRGRFLFCRLPSGRALAYCKPALIPAPTPWGEVRPKLTYMTVDSNTRQWVRTDTYGGKLMENIIQGLCRDLMAYAIVNLETGEAPYDIVLHTHDEIGAECDEGAGDLAEFEQLVAQLPPWAEGFPLTASGWHGRRYKKD